MMPKDTPAPPTAAVCVGGARINPRHISWIKPTITSVGKPALGICTVDGEKFVTADPAEMVDAEALFEAACA